MKLSTFSIIWAILYIGFGLGLLLIPVQFMDAYGVSLDDDGTMMARILGAALTSFAIVFWLNRNTPATDKSWHNVLLASLIYNIIDIPIVLVATLEGVMNALGWMPVGLHLFLAATFGLCLFKRELL